MIGSESSSHFLNQSRLSGPSFPCFRQFSVFTSSSHRLLKIFFKDISTIFFDFKHYKPKKNIVSTRCFAFTEQDEFKPGPACIEF